MINASVNNSRSSTCRLLSVFARIDDPGPDANARCRFGASFSHWLQSRASQLELERRPDLTLRQATSHRAPLAIERLSPRLRTMPSITNVGGSLTSAIALTLIAWAFRFVRTRNSRKQQDKELQFGRYHASLSAAAVQLMVSGASAIAVCSRSLSRVGPTCVVIGQNGSHSTHAG